MTLAKRSNGTALLHRSLCLIPFFAFWFVHPRPVRAKAFRFAVFNLCRHKLAPHPSTRLSLNLYHALGAVFCGVTFDLLWKCREARVVRRLEE